MSVDLRFYDHEIEWAYLNQLGENIRRARRERKVSQETLALVAGLSVTYLGTIERGQGNPSAKTLLRICFALDLTLPDLLPDNVPPCRGTQHSKSIYRKP